MEKMQYFDVFINEQIRQMKRSGRERTAETYSTARNSFLRFLDGKQLLFNDITPELIERYEAWLRKGGVCRNTSSFYLRILRAVYNRAVEADYTRQRNPFRHVYTGVDKTVKRAVSLQTIRKIDKIDLSAEPDLAFARDMFMFSFRTRGMSFIDMAYLKKENLKNGVLCYTRRKTGQSLRVRWEPSMQEILDRYPPNPTGYLLPIIRVPEAGERGQYKRQILRVNTGLRTLSDRLGLTTPLTTYVARHSWASIAYSRNIPLPVITEGMGHDSERTTRIYLASLGDAVVDRANSSILQLL